MTGDIETRYLTTDICGHVYLRMEAGLVYLGPIESCGDEICTSLDEDFERLRALWREANNTGRAFEATVRAAFGARHDPKRW